MPIIIRITEPENPIEEFAQEILQQYGGDVDAAIKYVKFSIMNTPSVIGMHEGMYNILTCLEEWKTIAESEEKHKHGK